MKIETLVSGHWALRPRSKQVHGCYIAENGVYKKTAAMLFSGALIIARRSQHAYRRQEFLMDRSTSQEVTVAYQVSGAMTIVHKVWTYMTTRDRRNFDRHIFNARNYVSLIFWYLRRKPLSFQIQSTIFPLTVMFRKLFIRQWQQAYLETLHMSTGNMVRPCTQMV